MRFATLASLASTATLAAAQAPSMNDYSAADIASGAAFQDIWDIANDNMRSNIGSRTKAQCTYENAKVRREWRTLPQATRKSFTDAVVCLQNMDPQVMTAAQAAQYPGVKCK